MRWTTLWASVLLMLTACQPGKPEPDPSPVETRAAVLDWESSDITLPIDAYGMSRAEIHRVEAAASIEMARCVTGQDRVSDDVVAEARRAIEPLRPDHWATHWLFGFWNADYIAAHGWRPFPEGPEPPSWIDADESTLSSCLEREPLATLQPVHSSMTDPASTLLMEINGESLERAEGTEEFTALISQRASCVTEKGHRTDSDSSLRNVEFPAEDEESMLRAALVEAQCSDFLGVTQRLGDLVANFQTDLIREHRAELLSVKAEADSRVARANKILTEVGIQ